MPLPPGRRKITTAAGHWQEITADPSIAANGARCAATTAFHATCIDTRARVTDWRPVRIAALVLAGFGPGTARGNPRPPARQPGHRHTPTLSSTTRNRPPCRPTAAINPVPRYGGDAYYTGYTWLKIPVPDAKRLADLLTGTEFRGKVTQRWTPGSWRMHVPIIFSEPTGIDLADTAQIHFPREQIPALTSVLENILW
jgi:hypothetical protein